FNRKQRVALAARDGGCRRPGCERPPSWTEAHHIQHWVRDHRRTDLANGTNRKYIPKCNTVQMVAVLVVLIALRAVSSTLKAAWLPV
ncbi:MAG: HNH endonuclease signature motif containing protein, partial [Lacisediminihabitans sp.]